MQQLDCLESNFMLKFLQCAFMIISDSGMRYLVHFIVNEDSANCLQIMRVERD